MTTPSVSPASSGEQLSATADFLRASQRLLSRAFEGTQVNAAFAVVGVTSALVPAHVFSPAPLFSIGATTGAAIGFFVSTFFPGSTRQKTFRLLCCAAMVGVAGPQLVTAVQEPAVRAENQVRFGGIPITQGDQFTLTIDQFCALKPATTPMLNGDFVIAQSARTGQQIRASCN